MAKEESSPFRIRFRFPTNNESRPTQLLCTALSVLPDEVLAFFQKNPILFCGETKEHTTEAVRFTEDTKEYTHIVHFHARLWDHSDEEIVCMILIQIAHCYLGTKSGFWSWEQSSERPGKQENEAKKLVDRWIQNSLEKMFGVKKTVIILNRCQSPAENRVFDSYR